MTDPRSKSETISETCKAALIEKYIQIKYGREKDIVSRFLQKGTLAEEDSVTLLSRIRGQFYRKNKTNLKNRWLTGTPDLYEGDSIERAAVIYDIKTSWDIFTFWKAKTTQINKDYYFQLQSYMDLTGAKVAYLVYCLVNTPDVLIEAEKRKFAWNSQTVENGQLCPEALAEIERLCVYDDIPLAERVHIIRIDRSQDDIDRLHARVEQCRVWMAETFTTAPEGE
ncbi:MAG: hypothetical protein PHS30_04720 [Bacteroidales bacterium]|nr:hypothetical protein [Bacteroidales bacterium]